ncbi:MAG: GNAT family N-acetyltransferase [Francisellaceae bacterium]|nr:GNAT family N-acetyltransferase [Francisellaceae bacterium]
MVIFETNHFTVRHCLMEDTSSYLKFWNDPLVMQYIGDGTWGGGIEKVNKALCDNITSYKQQNTLGYCSVVDKSSVEVVGDAGLALLHETSEIEVGYLLRRDYWGRGLGTELLRGLIKYGFEKLNIETIVAVVSPENTASIRLLNKCGMKLDGKGVFHNRKSLKFSISSPMKI